MEDLRVAIIQTSLFWENKALNLSMFNDKIACINKPVDIIVLPEMFSTGFSMQSHKFAEKMDGPTVNWLKQKAKEKNTTITGSIIIEENGNYYNRLLWVTPEEKVLYYNKRHLFRMAGEQEHYSSGINRKVAELKGWKIALMVCYDLRFPVWSRRSAAFDYDAMIFVANWPQRRSHPWNILLAARAIENQSYVIGVNRIGEDGNGIMHSGDSAVYDFKGEKLSQLKPFVEKTEIVVLRKKDLFDFRNSFPAHLDADSFHIN